ncbi:MAG: hypothetical protein ABI411_11035 [Tahibacter sp.]
MNAFNKCLVALTASIGLASCGGGGGSGSHGAFEPPNSGTLTLTATSRQLPVNSGDVIPFNGSPYQVEVDITWRRSNGDLVQGTLPANVAINPVTVAAFSTLDDPSTPDVNETTVLLGSGPVNITGGHGTVFINSRRTAGTATLSVTATDTGSPASAGSVSATMTFTVINATPPLPATIAFSATPTGIYTQETGGRTSSALSAVVRDGGGQLVPDPVAGNTAVNNVKFEIVGNSTYGTLTAVTASGAGNSGTSVLTRTVRGVGGAAFSSGSVQGPIQIRVTVDRADNNVDNGISDPLTSTTTITVSDGKLAKLSISNPIVDAIVQGRVLTDVVPASGTPVVFPANGFYQLTVAAKGTDTQGNPVPANTVIRFGAIDAPLSGFPDFGSGNFDISGSDGNPAEGLTLFTAPTGHFTTAGGGTNLGDTLLVFGNLVPGNDDLESARTVSTINSGTSLNVSVPFNRNDATGNIVNSGNVLPYVIGRARDASVFATGTNRDGVILGVTDENGVASAVLTYPLNKLGKGMYLYAQGDGASNGTFIKKVTAIQGMAFAGIAPAKLTSSPEDIPGNGTSAVHVCIIDALGAPLQGIFVDFAFTNLGAGGTGSVDGVASSGTVAAPTGGDGCTIASVTTSGLGTVTGGTATNKPQVVFSAIGLSDFTTITAGGSRSLTASPSAVRGSGATITLTLRDAAGNPVAGVLINAVCTGDVTTVPGGGPGVTNAQGVTTARIDDTGGLNGFGESGSGECKFTAASGETATVTFTGVDQCNADLSPPDPRCSTSGGTTQTLTVNVSRNGPSTCGLTVTSNPTGIICSIPSGAAAATLTCTAPFAQGANVGLNAQKVGASPTCDITAGNAPVVQFSGGCVPLSAGNASTNLTGPQTCNVIVN